MARHHLHHGSGSRTTLQALACFLAIAPSACTKQSAPPAPAVASTPAAASVASAPSPAPAPPLDDPATCPRSLPGTAANAESIDADDEELFARSRSPAGEAAIVAAHSRELSGANAERAVTRDDDPSRLPPAIIQAAIKRHTDAYRGCYDAGVARHPTLAGKVTVRFAIGVDGKMSALRVAESTMPDCEVVRCLLDRVGQVAFPPATGRRAIVHVVYPFAFQPQ